MWPHTQSIAALHLTMAPAHPAGFTRAAEFDICDRGRKDRLDTRPLLPPNRASGSPAHGSPVGGSPQSGLTETNMGCFHAEQPLFGKERVRPALMSVTQTTVTTYLVTLQKNPSQAPS